METIQITVLNHALNLWYSNLETYIPDVLSCYIVERKTNSCIFKLVVRNAQQAYKIGYLLGCTGYNTTVKNKIMISD